LTPHQLHILLWK